VIRLVHLNNTLFIAQNSTILKSAFHIARNAERISLTLTMRGPSQIIIDALQIGNLTSFPEDLVADKDGEEAHGLYSYASVVGILQYLHSHWRSELTFSGSNVA